MGQRIAKARGAKGWTQADLAKAIGKKPQQVSAWERDEGQPRAANLSALADALGVRPEWLVLGQEPRTAEIVAEQTGVYSHDLFDTQLMGACINALIDELTRRGADRPAPEKLGAIVNEIYLQCEREKKQPTAEVVAPFIRILMA